MLEFRTIRVAAVVAFILLLASCKGQQEVSAPGDPNILTIREASASPVTGWQTLKFLDANQGEIWVDPTPVLTLEDVQTAGQIRDENGRQAISVRFTASGGEKFRKFTSERIGKQAAIVFDGKVMNAPKIQSEISR